MLLVLRRGEVRGPLGGGPPCPVESRALPSHGSADLFSMSNVSSLHRHGPALDWRGGLATPRPTLVSKSALYPRIRHAKISQNGITFLFSRSPAPLETEEQSLAQICMLLHVSVRQGVPRCNPSGMEVNAPASLLSSVSSPSIPRPLFSVTRDTRSSSTERWPSTATGFETRKTPPIRPHPLSARPDKPFVLRRTLPYPAVRSN